MNVTTMTMPKDEARQKLREVRRALHKRADAEYQQLEEAYVEAARGRPLLTLSTVIQAAPRDALGRPRLAIARADRNQIRYKRNQNWAHEAFDGHYSHRHRGRVPLFTNISVSLATPAPGFALNSPTWTGSTAANLYELIGYSLVPIVPPSVRNGAVNLARHHILWEVESWSDVELGVQPDRDPYLLKRVSDDLYAVIAEWDLTDIERAVMRGRAGQ